MAQAAAVSIRRFILGSKSNVSIGIQSNHTYRTSTSIYIDRRTIEKICKQMNRIVKYCQLPEMSLKTTPPNMLDILTDFYRMLTDIISYYEKRLHILNDIEYFRIFIYNIYDLCIRTLEFFKRSSHHISDEQSTSRKYFIKLSLYFSHNLAELKSLFDNGIYQGDRFRLTKQEAVDFWKKYFNERTIVPWEEFEDKLNLVHPIPSYNTSLALKNMIDLTNNNHVSIFEFDVFTRLFHPWSTILNNWKSLTIDHPGFMEFMTYDEVKEILINYIDKPGSYVFRLSCTRLGQWAIGYVTSQNTILQTIPQAKPLIQALIEGECDGYYKYPNGKNINIDLSSILRPTKVGRICVSEEQHKIYCDMGTRFELCKICSTNNKDCKIQPCGHLICQSCLIAWQNQNISKPLPLCPFCRSEIKGFESVIITEFQMSSKSSQNKKSNKIHNQRSDTNSHGAQTSSDSKSFIAPPIPPRPITMKKVDNVTSRMTRKNSCQFFKQYNLPPLQVSSSLQITSTTTDNTQPDIKNDNSENIRQSYDFSANSNSQIQTIDHLRNHLKNEDNFDERRIEAALTLTEGLSLSKQYAMAKLFLNQVREEQSTDVAND